MPTGKTKSDFGKYRRCSCVADIIALIVLLLYCGQLVIFTYIKQLGLDTWYRLNQALTVLLVLAGGIFLVLCLLMMRYAKCPHCGKSVLSKWWNYERMKRIRKCQPIRCACCGKEIETA